MAETGTGSGRSLSSAGLKGIARLLSLIIPHPQSFLIMPTGLVQKSGDAIDRLIAIARLFSASGVRANLIMEVVFDSAHHSGSQTLTV